MPVTSLKPKTARTPGRRFASALPALSLFAPLLLAGCSAGSVGSAGGSASSSAPASKQAPLLTAAIDESRLVTLAGNTHPKANAKYDLGALDPATPLEHLQLVLKRSPAQELALQGLIDRLHDPKAPEYHQWLTPQQFGDSFGVAQEDVDTVSRWLASHGFTVESLPTSRMFVEFTGTAGQIRDTFHTEVHALNVAGVRHIGNVSDPSIPAALAPVVVGIHSLHDFMPRPLHRDLGSVTRSTATGKWQPNFTVNDGSSGTFYAVAPADFATIYNLNPLFSEGYRGAGQTVVVIEDTNIKNASDVTSFRSAFGLSGYKGTFSQVHPTGKTTCKNPGVNAAEGEAALDAEWAGSSAPDAAIELASCADTSTVFGGLIAVQNLINGASPPKILSISYGECEAENGATANASYVSTYEQAAAEGVSVFVSAGDEGAASCDADEDYATHGIAVSGFASTPYNVAVGGTDFMDDYDSASGGPALSTYWSAANSATYSSALSYIPEIPWNDSCASKLIYSVEGYSTPYGSAGFCSSSTGAADYLTTASGSGGPSAYSKQPSWQTGVVGLPTSSGGKRYLPDVSLFAANGVWGHFYVYCMSDSAEGGVACNYTSTTDILDLAAGGTSFASPALAGIQAIVNQKTGSAQGNPNPTYYRLAAAEYGAGGSSSCNSDRGTPTAPALPASTCIFNDVTAGDIDVPCTGTDDCYGYSKSGRKSYYGALSPSSSSFSSAYPAGTGWDYATGLGTVNAYNLVTNW
jgi:subtilase family serine protease